MLNRKKHGSPGKASVSGTAVRKKLLDQEKGSYLKKWTGLLPVALLYPNNYRVGMSSLGFQIVYHLLNQDDRIVCERVFLPDEAAGFPVSMESGRLLGDFPVLFISVSFEHDYVNVARMLLSAGIEPFAAVRKKNISKTSPLVIIGGVAMFMNPEPLAPFADLVVVGEAEPLMPELLELLCRQGGLEDREKLLFELNTSGDGFYSPAFYEVSYDQNGCFSGFQPREGLPGRIRKAYLKTRDHAGHSELLTPETEFADLYLTELGRGCSRGCRFCTAGFIYRPPRLWECDAVLESLDSRPEGTSRVGLLGMEMTSAQVIESIIQRMQEEKCTLSFSSLRADRISGRVLDLLSESDSRSAAIAPDGASERIRKVINKGLSENDLISAARKLFEAGLFKLKLYLMIGLPSETDQDLAEFLLLVRRIRTEIDPIGKKKGRLCEITVSVNSFVPKAWTPFQYHPFGVAERQESGGVVSGESAVKELKRKIRLLKKGLKELDNTRASFDRPDNVLFQAVLARGDRRLAEVLLEIAASGISWKQALAHHGLSEELFATRQYDNQSKMAWEIIDHSINAGYLWKEYLKAFQCKETVPCDTEICRRCGVCDG